MSIRSVLAAAAAGFVALSCAHAADVKLTVYDWTGFNQKNLIPHYAAKYGDQPKYLFYGDDLKALKAIEAGLHADVAHPCSESLGAYRSAGAILPWDVSRIPNFSGVSQRFLKSPIIQENGRVWFIPTDVGLSAMLYNADKAASAGVEGLGAFVDPRFKGKVSLPAGSDDAWALAFLATGTTDWSNVSEAQMKAAEDWLRRASRNGAAFWSSPDQLNALMTSGRVTVAWAWVDSAIALQKRGANFAFRHDAKQTASAWYCGWVRVKNGSGDAARAEDFVNDLLSPAGARGYFVDFVYMSPNKGSAASVEKASLLARTLNPHRGRVLVQTPLDARLRQRMKETYRRIRSRS